MTKSLRPAWRQPPCGTSCAGAWAITAPMLSLGQQQRLCLARCLAISPRVILMDEPTASLDPTSSARIEASIRQLRGAYTVIIVTHNLQQAQRVADRTAFLYQGLLVEAGDT